MSMNRKSAGALLLFIALPVGLALAEGSCTCPDPLGPLSSICLQGVPCPAGEVRCCPIGGCAEGGPDVPDFNCRKPLDCAEVAALFETKPGCTDASECPGPPDPRCGEATCIDRVCGVDIYEGLRLEAQRPGDCLTFFCSAVGKVIAIEDPSDVPSDGNECTLDICELASSPINVPLGDVSPCPESPEGICVAGHCVTCSQALGTACPNVMKCDIDRCVVALCVDGMLTSGESDIDCGGAACRPCPQGSACNVGSDCVSKVCTGSFCQPPTHDDAVSNGDETGVDCGCQGCANKCQDGEACRDSAGCMSNLCYRGLCQVPTCLDATMNGDETGVDCGGPCPPCQI